MKQRFSLLRALSLLSSLLLFTSGTLHSQASFEAVSSNSDAGAGSLRTVIQNASAGAVVIFSESLSGDTIRLTTGPILINKNIRIYGPEDGLVYISGERSQQIFHIQSGAEVILRDMHLINGKASGGAKGGAVFNEGILRMQQLYFSGNTVQGVATPPSGAIMSFGGAIANDGVLYAQRCVFRENIIIEASGVPSGAALANFNYAELRYCTFEKNEALAGSYSAGGTAKGGAIYNDGRIKAYGCSFTENNASGSSQVQSGSGIGGAVNNLGYFYASASTFSGNECGGDGLFGGGGLGGAIFNQDSLILDQVTISGNEATGGGRLGGATGAGIITYGFTRITNSTITENTTYDSSPAATIGGGIDIKGPLELGGTIIANNIAFSSGFPYPAGSDANLGLQATVVDLGYNLIGSNISLNLANARGNILNPTGFTLEPLADNGGPGLTHALAKGNPALDAGDPFTSLSTDQRGYNRVVNGRADIGAFEEGPCEMWVTNTHDDGAGSFRHALSYAQDGCVIQVDPALRGRQILLLSGEISVTRALTVNGPGKNQLFLRSDRTTRLLKVQPAADLRITDMSMVLGNVYDKAGGAIFNRGTLALSEIAISNCYAYSGNAIYNMGELSLDKCNLERNGVPLLVFQLVAGAEGGAIYNTGTLTGKESIFSNNIAGLGSGGGIAKGGAIYNAGSATLHTSTFSSNKAGGGTNGIVTTPEGYGGGIYNTGSLAITSCLFSQNEAIAYGEKFLPNPPYNPGMGIADGGAIYSLGGLQLRSSTFSENESNEQSRPDQFSNWATSSSGGIYAAQGKIDGCTFVGNKAGLTGALQGLRTLAVGNSLFAANEGNFTLDGGISAGYNLIDSLKNANWPALSSDLSGTVSVPLDPQLDPLAAYGGPTHTYALRSSSPAIDAGNPDSPQDYDQRGYARPTGKQRDIGAFEANASHLINITEPATGDSFSSTSVIRAEAEITGLEIPYLEVTCPDFGHRRLRHGNNPNSIWGPRVDVTTGGNDHLLLRIRDPKGTIDWEKIALHPDGNNRNPIKFSSYLPKNPGTDWITVSIPLSDFDPSIAFQRLAYVEFPASNKAGPFEMHVGEITFTGGSSPYRWFGLDELDNINDGNGDPYRLNAQLKGNSVAAYVTSVKFELDGHFVGEDPLAPYAFEYEYLPPGTYSLTAVAVLSDGNCFRSPPVDIVVTQPEIEIVAPRDSSVFVAPATLTLRAEVAGVTGPDYLQITCPDNAFRKLGIGNNPGSIWSPNVDVTSGGNNKMEITLRDPNENANWSKLEIHPQGSIANPVVLANYIPPQGIGENWVTITIPLSDFDPGIDFSQISYIELPYSRAAGPFEIHIQQIRFTGGNQPFVWLGPGKMDNANNGFGQISQLTAKLIRGNGNGPVTQVDFYTNGNLLGSDTEAPYTFDWFQIPVGNYTLTSQATLSNGVVIVSDPVYLMISNSRRQAAHLGDGFEMKAFPNPVRDRLTLNFESSEAEVLKLRLLDLNGRSVLRESLQFPGGKYRHRLDLGELPAGVYLLSVDRQFGEDLLIKLVKR